MPHDAAVYYPTDHLYIDSPAETAALNEAEVEAARASYGSSAESSYSQYADRVGVVHAPVIDSLDPVHHEFASYESSSEMIIHGSKLFESSGLPGAVTVAGNAADLLSYAPDGSSITVAFSFPGPTGSYPVIVTVDGVESNSMDIEFVQTDIPPVIDSLDPVEHAFAAGETSFPSLMIYGSNLMNEAGTPGSVKIGEVTGSILVWAPDGTSLEVAFAALPATGAYPVIVTANGVASNSMDIQFTLL